MTIFKLITTVAKLLQMLVEKSQDFLDAKGRIYARYAPSVCCVFDFLDK